MVQNIRLINPNMARDGGYFYSFNEETDVMVQKTDDGTLAFAYPLDTPIPREVTSTIFDGESFWTQENISATAADGFRIRRWVIENFVMVLQQTFTFASDSNDTFESSALTVEDSKVSELDSVGNRIDDEIINIVSKDTVHEEIEAALGRIGIQIDWGTPLPDIQPPRLVELIPPLDQTTNVSIFSTITARIEDPLPAAGIDLSTLNMSLTFLGTEFPIVTSGVAEPGEDVEFRGNVFDLTTIYRPKVILT